MTNINDFINDKDTIKLNKYSGEYLQDTLGLIWHPFSVNDLDFVDETDTFLDINIYYERYMGILESDYLGKVPEKLKKLRRMALDKKGYFFHINRKNKQYIGFRKAKSERLIDIINDLEGWFTMVD